MASLVLIAVFGNQKSDWIQWGDGFLEKKLHFVFFFPILKSDFLSKIFTDIY